MEQIGVGPADDLLGLIAIQPTRPFVPQQDRAVDALTDDRVLG